MVTSAGKISLNPNIKPSAKLHIEKWDSLLSALSKNLKLNKPGNIKLMGDSLICYGKNGRPIINLNLLDGKFQVYAKDPSILYNLSDYLQDSKRHFGEILFDGENLKIVFRAIRTNDPQAEEIKREGSVARESTMPHSDYEINTSLPEYDLSRFFPSFSIEINLIKESIEIKGSQLAEHLNPDGIKLLTGAIDQLTS